MNTTPHYEKEDILINFRDMLVHILLRWRSILAGVLLITLLAGGAKYLLDYRDYQNALNTAAGTVSTLSAAEQANVDNALGYHKAYEAAVAYNNASPLMAIDYTAVPTMTMTFSVKSGHSYNTAATYQPMLRDPALYDELVAAGDIPYSASYLPELVTSSILYRTESVADPDEPVLLQVEVIGSDEGLSRRLANGLKAKLNTLAGCAFQGEQFTLAVDSRVKLAQSNNLNAANSLRTTYKAVREALTSQEVAALEQLIAGVENDGTMPPVKPSVSKKFLVLGFAVGGVLMVVIYGLGYVLNRQVKSPEDMQERFGLCLLGTLPEEGGKARRLDRWIVRLFRKKSPLTAEQAFALTARQVRLAAAEGTLLLTGSTLTEEDTARLQPLAAALEKEGVTLTVAPSPLQDAAALDALSKADGVVLVEKQRVSAYNDIYCTLELCQRLDTPVRGTLLL